MAPPRSWRHIGNCLLCLCLRPALMGRIRCDQGRIYREGQHDGPASLHLSLESPCIDQASVGGLKGEKSGGFYLKTIAAEITKMMGSSHGRFETSLDSTVGIYS